MVTEMDPWYTNPIQLQPWQIHQVVRGNINLSDWYISTKVHLSARHHSLAWLMCHQSVAFKPAAGQVLNEGHVTIG